MPGRNDTGPAAILAGVYLTVAALCIAYELGIRLFDRGNSEFAGMLSFALTLPGVFATMSLAETLFGVRVGDSDLSFVIVLGLAAVLNAGAIFVAVRWVRGALGRRRQ